MSSDLATKIFRMQGQPPYGFPVQLSEDVIPNPETKEPMTVYYLLFKNSLYQRLAQNRQKLVDVARWLKDTHDAMRNVGLRVIIQPIFDDYEGLQADSASYKKQLIIDKR